MNRSQMRRRIAATTYRALYWARHHVAPGLRSLLGVLLMAGGVVGFLPVLGFWMLPLGVAFVALDIPGGRRHIELWMMRLARDAAPCRSDPPVATPCRSDPPVATPCRSDLPVANGQAANGPVDVRAREGAPTTRKRRVS